MKKSFRKIVSGVLLILSFTLLNSGFVLAGTNNPSDSYAPIRRVDINTSTNWSGYVMPNGYFTEVQGSWEVPKVNPQTNTRLQAEASWIGIGGVKSKDLIQVGTQSFADHQGKIYYYAFYEILPKVAIPLSMEVHAGDKISAQVLETSSDTWLISIRNDTTGEIFTKTLNYKSSHSSAEWIEERPIEASTGEFLPLDDFQAVTFNSASATMNGRVTNLKDSTADAEPITMRQGGIVLATPSTINSDGSFNVTKSQVSAPTFSSINITNSTNYQYKIIRGKNFEIIISFR